MPLADRIIKLCMVVVVVVVASVSFTVSYSHIYGLVTIAGGEPHFIAALIPISIDGVLLSSSLTLLFCSRYDVPRPTVARCGQVLGIGLTLAANILHGLAYSAAAAYIGAWPAISLIFCSELLWWVVKTSRSLDKREVVVYERQPANKDLDAVLTILANDRSVSGAQIARETGISYPRVLGLAKQARQLLSSS